MQKMKWLFVQKGTKQSKIIFIACDETGKPIRKFEDMNLAWHYERDKKPLYSVTDFNLRSREIIQANFRGEKIDDDRPIIGVKDFNAIQKQFGTEIKL